MIDESVLKILGQFGAGGIIIYIIGRVLWTGAQKLSAAVWQIGTRLIEAIDRVGAKIDTHTEAISQVQKDVALLGAQVKSGIEVLSNRVDVAIDWSERSGAVGVPSPIRAVPSSANRTGR